jgi:ABC-type antimicrobial peptide transport system permease subunit
VNSPPSIFTTLAGAAFFASRTRFDGAPGEAFISAVRVRVEGADTPGSVAQARLSRVAAEIRDATGLAVDIVAGSSPETIKVDLAAGNFGRPPLTVSEFWSVKGVAFRFVKALEAHNLGLFAMVLLGAVILVGETAFISVRRRRPEFGVLRALGWRSRTIARLVELEMLVLGLGVGLIVLLVVIPLSLVLPVAAGTWQLLAAVPLTIAVAACAAILPALGASRGTTASVLKGGGRIRSSRIPRSAIALGLRELGGTRRVETALGVGAVALGAAMLGGVLLLVTAFRGELDTTLLGNYLAVRVRPFHTAIAILTLAVGSLAAGEIVTLGYLERRIELATLRALGWPRTALVQLLLSQAVALGLLGGLTGSVVVATGGVMLRAPIAAILETTALTCGAALIGTLVAAAGPLALVYGSSLAEALKGGNE